MNDNEDIKIIDEKIDKIIADILKIPGHKIVTLSFFIDGKDEHFIIDIDKKGKIGYDPSHIDYFRMNLAKSIIFCGALIVRQFLKETIKVVNPNTGKDLNIPKKNIYGMTISEGTHHWLLEEKVFEAMNSDKNGNLIDSEEGLNYCSYLF